jgi:hypothetical protein
LTQEAQKKKLCKKKMPFFALTPRGRSLLKKRRKTTAQSQCEHLDKSKFETFQTQKFHGKPWNFYIL